MMKNIKIIKNPFLLFLPFLILYILIVFIFPTNGTFGDENRYLMFAHNLINGFYSPPPPAIDLGNGPGYSIILIPILKLHLPLICITILNAILYYLSVVFVFKSLKKVASHKLSLIISVFWAFYFNSYEYLPIIYTETFVVFLISLLIFTLLKVFNSNTGKKYFFLSGFLIGYIALTKPIFGYVLTVLLAGISFLWLINKDASNYKKSLVILLISLLTCSPYLIYNYHLTGRIFYWGSNGGNNLYWMTSPYEGENGSWIEYPITQIGQAKRIKGSDKIIEQLHKEDFEEIFKYKGVQQDDVYKKIAINNIESHPLKFLKNCFSNVGRILFNFPRAYELQKPGTLLRLPLNGIILVLALFCLIPTLINWRKILFPLRFLLFFVLVYLGGSILGSAETRMFTMIVPPLLVWIAFILNKTAKFSLRFGNKT